MKLVRWLVMGMIDKDNLLLKLGLKASEREETIKELRAQNERYRKALDEIVNHKHTQDCFRFKDTIVHLNNCALDIAQQALSEGENG